MSIISEFTKIIVSKGFSKVSFTQFAKDMAATFPYFEDKETLVELKAMYDGIILPTRSTDYSAGYDFYAPFAFTLKPGNTIKIPTGIRANINQTWFLLACPKSGLGCKYHVKFANTIGIVDSDYALADNEGHIFLELSIESSGICVPNSCFGRDITTTIRDMEIEAGNKFAQGIFLPYGVVENDDEIVKTKRTGGFGSTGK